MSNQDEIQLYEHCHDIYDALRQLEVSRELERLIRQCFEIVRSTVTETGQGLHSAATRNHLPSQASLG